VTGFSDGQMDARVLAHHGDTQVGKLQYSVFRGTPYIHWIEVHPEHRRQGIATAMVRHMQKESGAPNPVSWGMMTPEGGRLRAGVKLQDERARPTLVLKARRPVPEVPIPDEIRNRTYYHATDREDHAQSILRDGVIKPGAETQGRGHLAPVAGKVYLTHDQHYASIYALGGVLAGHQLPESFKTKDRHGYIFEVHGHDFKRVQPDEDSVGRLAHNALNGQKVPWSVSGRLHSLNPKTKADLKFGYYNRFAQVGKMLVRDMEPREHHEILKMGKIGNEGVHVAHDGPLPIKAAWRIDKTKSHLLRPDASNLFEVAERVPFPTEKSLVLKAVSPDEGEVTLYHGTTLKNAHAILREGFKTPDHRAIANQIEAHYNLPKDSVWNHPSYSFNAKFRSSDPHVYLSGSLETARHYTHPEPLTDALTSAYQVMHPEWGQGHGDRSMQDFVSREAPKHAGPPAVLSIKVPWHTLAESFPRRPPISRKEYESYGRDLPTTVPLHPDVLRGAEIRLHESGEAHKSLVLKASANGPETSQKLQPSATGSAPLPRIIRRPEDLEEVRGWGTERWMQWKHKPGSVLTGNVLKPKDLPDTLHHVTSDLPGVTQAGLLLGKQDGGGFGGGQAEGVSFTTDRGMAEHLHREMLRMGRVARGEVHPRDFHQFAQEDESLHGLPQGALLHALDYAQRMHDVNAQSPVYDSPEKLRGLAKDSYNSYLIARDTVLRNHGQPSKNPMFFTDPATAAKWTPDRVGIVSVPKSAIPKEALVTSGSDDWLHEARAYSDVPVQGAQFWPAAQDPVQSEKPIWQYARHEYAPLPRGAGTDQHDSTVFQDYLSRDQAWRAGMRSALSEGQLHPDQARRQGYDESHVLDKLQNLPETLYHVTTARSKVLAQGLKSRQAQGKKSGAGLGGGDDDAISLTDNPQTAQRIHDAMQEARALLRGEIKPEDLLHQAATGQGASKPWLRDLLRNSGSMDIPQEDSQDYRLHSKDWRQHLPPGWQAFLQGQTIQRGSMQTEIPTSGGGAMKVSDIQDKGFIPTGPTWRGGDGELRAMHYVRPMTDDERLQSHMGLYKLWSAMREQAGGPEDPLFFLSDPKALATTPKEDISVLPVRPQKGARGIKMNALGEWRTYSGKALQVAGAAQKSEGALVLKARVREAAKPYKTALDFVRQGDYGIITAENPGSKPAPFRQNKRRMQALHQDLQARGYKPIQATSRYQGQVERSFVVPGLRQDHGHALSRKYGQSAWISRWKGVHRMFFGPHTDEGRKHFPTGHFVEGRQVRTEHPSTTDYTQIGAKRFAMIGWHWNQVKQASEGAQPLVIRQFTLHTPEGDVPVELTFDPSPRRHVNDQPGLVLRVNPSVGA
jgi:hypothetical protein